jgi:phenylalanyl-tRNA synthetase beta chain
MGHMDRLCKSIGENTPTYESVEMKGYQKAFTICVGKEVIGVLGTVDAVFVKDLGLEIDNMIHCFSLEINKLMPLLRHEQTYTPINLYPIVERDIDFVFPEETETGVVSQKILQQNYPNLTEVFPIDIFRHKSVGEDQKSVTFHFRFQHPDKTLEDKEVSSVINKIKRLVLSEFDAKLRSSN